MINALGLLENGMYAELNRCPACLRREQEFQQSVMEVNVEAIESYEQAEEKGWRKVNSHVSGKQGKLVWVCPDCMEELMPVLLE